MPHHSSSESSVDDERVDRRSRNNVDLEDEKTFFERLYRFMDERGSPIEKIPIFDHKELDLYQLYKGVISRGGLETVIEHKLWRQITNELSVDPERTDAGFRLRIHYLKYLYPYERKFFLGLEDDDFDYDSFERQISKSHTAQMRDKERSLRYLPMRKKKNMQNGNGVSHHPDKSAQKRSPNSGSSDSLSINFKLLDPLTLKRYKKFHQLKLTSSSTSKRELIEVVSQHFATQKVDEDNAINAFVARVRCHRECQREKEQRRRNASRKIISSQEDESIKF